MSLLHKLEAEAEHLLALLMHVAEGQKSAHGDVQPQTQELLDAVQAHVDATAPTPVEAPAPVEPAPVAVDPTPAPAPVADPAPATPAASA